ncbi:MFS transporter, DHA2 family, metal-tetracycline-proton antiporter [Seinonella peptonophila]|uniref:MFS transporter, DHA2 family, metal-tetracycline-proton antiporter n=1 Tax=Seinonella peptonophila TaxID=112248 RepID=A0A1M4UV05_9BACL|nr:MFS transporter [Seinonella peptonophila]SHE60430.1 MFS transporter, DHA2 family, metal-tetracycline-proton antiporter [Seinonella peptonophila]
MSQTTTQTSSEIKRIVPWIIYVIFFAVLNETVFNVSTPNIAKQFQLHPSQVSWIITIFIIFFGMGSVIFGKLSDMFSVKRLISIGIISYSASSLIGFIFNDTYPIVLFSRAIQGAGASAIPALVMVIVARYFTKDERGKLFGWITSTVSFAIGVGPVLGGYISGSFHWSYLFMIPVFSLVALPFLNRLLPHEETKEGRLDILGTLLMAIIVSTLILFVTEENWFYLIGTILSLIWFIIHIHRVDEPFVDPQLFSNPLYRSGIMIGFLVFSTVMGIMFLLPLMFNGLYHLESSSIGLIMFPGAFSAVIFGTVAGNMTVKKGSHFVVYLGLGFITLSLLLQSSLFGLWVWYIGMALILLYIGFSFLQTALIESVTNILPKEQVGVGMGFYNLTSFISGAIGTALVSKALESPLLKVELHPLVTHTSAYQYSNLLLIFVFVILVATLLYYFTFGRDSKTELSNESI